MATITPLRNSSNPRKTSWSSITENDTPAALQISGGIYTFAVEGTFGGGSLELKSSQAGVAYHSIDTDNLTFTADGVYDLEIGECYLKPVISDGVSTTITCTLTKIK